MKNSGQRLSKTKTGRIKLKRSRRVLLYVATPFVLYAGFVNLCFVVFVLFA
jgi:hypothetical protein